jgi:hypothetical protein
LTRARKLQATTSLLFGGTFLTAGCNSVDEALDFRVEPRVTLEAIQQEPYEPQASLLVKEVVEQPGTTTSVWDVDRSGITQPSTTMSDTIPMPETSANTFSFYFSRTGTEFICSSEVVIIPEGTVPTLLLAEFNGVYDGFGTALYLNIQGNPAYPAFQENSGAFVPNQPAAFPRCVQQ